jgi:hypothetical protein
MQRQSRTIGALQSKKISRHSPSFVTSISTHFINQIQSVHFVTKSGVAAESPPPNPSLNLSSNGMSPGPVWRYAVHFRQPGPGAMPLLPG